MMKKKVLLLLSLLLPWLLAPAMFALAVAAVRAWNTDSLITALVFVGTLAPSSLTFNGVFLSTCWSFSPRRSLRPIFLLRCCYLCAVLPLAAWIAAQRSCCKDAIQEPVFAPSFVAAIIATTCGTYVAILRPAISAGLEVAFGSAAVTLILTFWRSANLLNVQLASTVMN
jgi:hypothetical protein